MKQYYGYKSDIQGLPTVCIIPLTTEAAYQFGVYDFQEDQLTLVSKDTKEELKIVQKMTEFGEAETKVRHKGSKAFPLYERRLINNNLTFNLKGNDLSWFITNLVENNIIVSNLIDEAKEKFDAYVKSKTVQSPVEPETDSEDEQSFSPEAWGGLSGNPEQSRTSDNRTEEETEEPELVGAIPLFQP